MNTNYLPCTSDPDAWFNPETMHAAARICAEQCPLVTECLAACHSMPVSQQHYGVWGATRPEDRNKSLHKPCKTCGELRPSYGRGQCRRCWNRDYERKHRNGRNRKAAA